MVHKRPIQAAANRRSRATLGLIRGVQFDLVAAVRRRKVIIGAVMLASAAPVVFEKSAPVPLFCL